ncbi:MAG: T9SS type A sorting domain-containing protein [Flavobacteriales bacterium]|nr:MAG: T9SS type A sorting domain-containing protein [Flavobacteriales bacterium]
MARNGSYLLRCCTAVLVIAVSCGASAQEHCRVRYLYNASGDRTQRDWHCWIPGDLENEPEGWAYKNRNVLAAIHMEVAPNPSSDRFNVVLPGDAPSGTLSLVNALGAVLFSQNVAGTRASIEVGDIPNGAYYIRFSSGSESIISSCVVQH